MPTTTVRETLLLRHDALNIAVVADSHGKPHAGGLQHLAALRPDHILHAGDIGALHVLDTLARTAPVSAVRGNIDGHRADIPDVRVLEVADASGPLLTLLLLHIAVNGPRLRADAARLAEKERADVVLCGHSHVPFLGRDKDRVIFNPGSIGPRRFQLPILFGVIEITRAGVQMRHIDCETGAAWAP